MSEISAAISETLETNAPKKIPYFVGYSIGACFDVVSKLTKKKLPLSKSRVKNMTRNRSFRVDRSRKEIKYTPKVQLREGIEKTVAWGKKTGLL